MHGDAVVYESAVIDEYLEEKYPEPPLMPRDLAQKARARIWIDFCNTRLQATAHEVRYGNEPEKARAKLYDHLAILEREIAGKDYFVGNYSLADITFIPFFTRQERYGITIEKFPNLKQWYARVLARPAVESTL